MKTLLLILFSSFVIFTSCQKQKNGTEWQSLFNGTDLNEWDIKISGHVLNDNYKNTFVVEDSIIKVNYTEYDTFTHEFGHLYYKKPFFKYRLRMDYRIFGKLTTGSPYYAEANSGVMLHAQSAESQELNQNFPASIEMQFLSRIDNLPRATGNLASPGTHVERGDSLYTNHMMYANGKTFGDGWVHIEAIVIGDSVVHHVVEGDTVLTYFKPQIGGWENDSSDTWVKDKTWVNKTAGKPLRQGFIALQAEGHPVWFKNIEIMDLSHDK
ncbi:MAG: hypothetical protein ACI9DJ_002856 [Algoriphagus sp.]|jgi:hypothetical protein